MSEPQREYIITEEELSDFEDWTDKQYRIQSLVQGSNVRSCPYTRAEKVLDEVIYLIEKGIENCPNRSYCLHVIFLASTPEGREELRQQEKKVK